MYFNFDYTVMVAQTCNNNIIVSRPCRLSSSCSRPSFVAFMILEASFIRHEKEQSFISSTCSIKERLFICKKTFPPFGGEMIVDLVVT